MLLWNQGRTIAKTVDQGKIQGLPFLCPIRLHCCTNYNAPTGNLDSGTGHEVLGLLRVAAKRFSQTLILITHDMDIAQLADRIVCIEDGKIRKGSDEDAEK